eukprot:1201855-Pyramimonas_sp.AAC.1
MKDADGKWCTTCIGWATRAEGEDAARHGSGRNADAAAGDGGAERIRTMYRSKCRRVKAKQKSRSGSAKWKDSVGAV